MARLLALNTELTTDLHSHRGALSSPVSPISPIAHHFADTTASRLLSDEDLEDHARPMSQPAMSVYSPPDDAFCRRLPKVELHAHLTGSISRAILQQIWEVRVAAEGELGIEAPNDALSDPSGSQGIDVFFSHFNTFIYNLVSTPEALQLATRSVLQEFAADGVQYLELRTTPRALTPPRGQHTSAEASLRLVVTEIMAWNAAYASIMPVRLIVAVDRAKHDVNAAEWIVDLALRLRDEGAPIVALDLCGDPNKLIDVATLRAPFARARRAGLPCVLHFAEVLTSSSLAELEEMLSWKPRRLGHAIHVPAPMRERILALGAAPELCLSCNILAGMLPPRLDDSGHLCTRPAGFVDHHFGWWWAAGGPLSLGTDDVGVFGSPSSAEHRHAAEHFQLSRRDLVDLSRRAMAGALSGDPDELRMDRILDDFVRREGLEVEDVTRAFGGTELC